MHLFLARLYIRTSYPVDIRRCCPIISPATNYPRALVLSPAVGCCGAWCGVLWLGTTPQQHSVDTTAGTGAEGGVKIIVN